MQEQLAWLKSPPQNFFRAVLEVGLYQLLFMDHVEEYAAISEKIESLKKVYDEVQEVYGKIDEINKMVAEGKIDPGRDGCWANEPFICELLMLAASAACCTFMFHSTMLRKNCTRFWSWPSPPCTANDR